MDTTYIKKEEDNVAYIKTEDGGVETCYTGGNTAGGNTTGGRGKRKTPQPITPAEIQNNIAVTNGALATLKSQYSDTQRFEETNEANTHIIDTAIEEMEKYIYHLYKEGEVPQQLFLYCATILEATRKWNTTIVEQQQHMKTYILNNISYKHELHALYADILKRQPNMKRDPSSPFNTMQTEMETIPLNNENAAMNIF